MQDLRTFWLTISGNARGSVIIVLASLVAMVMSSLFKLLGKTIPVVEILFIRQLVMLLVISPVIIRNFDSVLVTNNFRLHILRGLLSGAAMFTGFTAIVYIPLAEVTAIGFIRTLFTAILAIIFLKEIIGPRRWASIFVGFVGVLIMLRPDSENVNIYAVYALASAFFLSAASIIVRTLSLIDNPSTIMVYQSIVVTLVMGGPAFFMWVTPTSREAVIILMIGILMVLVQWLYIQGFKIGEAAAIAPMEYSRLVFATVIGVIFFAEFPSLWAMTGAGIIIASTLYTLHRNSIKKQNTH